MVHRQGLHQVVTNVDGVTSSRLSRVTAGTRNNNHLMVEVILSSNPCISNNSPCTNSNSLCISNSQLEVV